MTAVYRMSEAGSCPRVLSAMRLGYESPPLTEEDEKRLKHYTRCEKLAIDQMLDEHLQVDIPAHKCLVCFKRGEDRHGHHVEIEETLFLLTGHLDAGALVDEVWLPVEIKSLGPKSWKEFQQNGFESFLGYAGQEVCYLKAKGPVGIYWVMNRDSGDSLKYVVNDFGNKFNLKGFEKIVLPITYDEVVNRLTSVEIDVQSKELSQGVPSGDCYWCKVKYLCVKEKDPARKVSFDEELKEAAELYRKGKELEELGEESKSKATGMFLSYAKENNINKIRALDVSFSYRGQKVKEYLDSGLLKTENPDVYQKYLKQSKPYEDYSIRILGKKED